MNAMVPLDILKQRLRMRVCASCPRRPRRGGNANPGQPLPCEATCPLFLNLEGLRRIAQLRDPMLKPVPAEMRRRIRRLYADAWARADPPVGRRVRRAFSRRCVPEAARIISPA